MIEIAGSFPEGKGQLARAYYKLGTLLNEQEKFAESKTFLEQAKRLKAEIKRYLSYYPSTEETFQKLTLWMLW